MKKISLNCLWATMAVLCLTVTSTFAQGQHRDHRGKESVERLQSVLDLTDEQTAELETLQDEHRTAMRALREQDFENPEDRKAAFKELMESHKANVESILTAEQKAQLEQHKEERAAQRAERKEDMKAMHEALKAYHQENIQPVMLEQRAKLEEKISAEDKATIEELRTAFAESKERMTELKEKYKEEGRRNEGAKEDFQALMEEQQDEKATLKALVEKYQDDIKTLHQEIEPQRQQWEEDMQAIKEDYLGERPQHGKRKGPHAKAKRHQVKPVRKAAHFLLMEPAIADTETNTNLAEAELSSYPNPTVNNSTLTYEVKTAGRVRIVLSDEQGNVLKTLIDGYQEEGSYTQEVDLSGLQNGSYYYTLTDKQGVRSQKIVIVE